MAINVVEILVRAKNESQAAFAEADASSKGMSKAFLATGIIAAGALGAIGYESIKMATTFQAQMERLVTQAGVPQSAIKGLGQGVLTLAGQVGFSPDSLAESLYHVASNMASMGATGPQMLNAVKTAAEGARVGGADLVDVTNALGAAIASGIPGVQNYQQAMGALNATVGAGDMTMQNLAEAMGTGFLANVKIYGSTLNDVGAILATFGDNNIRGAHAGTQLRMSVQSIAVQASTAAPYLQQLGLRIGELGHYQSIHGTVATINLLVDRLKAAKIPMNDWGNIITQLFGKKAGAGIAVLIDQVDRLNSKSKVLAKGAHEFGSAWQHTNETLAQKLADLRGKFDAVMTSIGEKLIPVATRLASFILGTLIPGIGQLVSWMARHRDVVIAVAAGIMTLFVPALVAWAVAAASAAVATIAAALPLIAIAAGVALLVYAILDLAHHWKQVWHDIKAWSLDGYRAVVGFFERMWHDVVKFAERIWNDVTGFFMRMRNDEDNFVARMWTDITGFFARMWNDVVQFAERIWNDVTNWFARLWHDVTNWVGRMVSDAVHWFEQLPGKIISALAALPGMLFRAGVNAINGLINGMLSMIGKVGSAMGRIASKAAGFFGLSPAVEGPLSGRGAPEIRGRHFAEAFAEGVMQGLPVLGMAASRMAGTAGGGGYGGYGGAVGGGGMQLVVTGAGSANWLALVKAIWPDLQLEVRTRGGGGKYSVQKALGQTWPQGG